MSIVKNLKKFLNLSLSLPRYTKKIIVILIDITLCIISFWLALYLRLDEFISIRGNLLIVALISTGVTIIVFWLFGLYRTMFRYSGKYALTSISFAVSIYGLFYLFIITIYGINGVPRSIGILQPLILFFVIGGSRLIIRYILNINSLIEKKLLTLQRALVYGAGSAGRQLVSSLENNAQIKVMGFIDDDPVLHDQVIQGKDIFSPNDLFKVINTKNIDLILLAFPSVNRSKRMRILKSISKYKVIVRTLPSINDLVEGKISFSDIRDLDVADILGRDLILPDKYLLSKNISNKVVLITGAGGSIGSELSRQIVKLNPCKLILVEMSEYSLYKINQDLEEIKKKLDITHKLEIISLLASVEDEVRISKILKTYKPDTLYHAAAYKHVSMVEENICEGIKNNIFGTLVMAKAAISAKVSNFVLISSDKAVRPTNIMGASKRIAELCLMALAENAKNLNTKFCTVRFGNVLDSSGSVIPKFKKQIIDGGPITLTHSDVTRYFMTIPEASQLVIQAGAMSEGSEVFVLDMGEPIKIKHLAKRIIELSGLSVLDEDNQEGDIKIEIIGLRPGEKLYEELLIGDNPQKTRHPKILKAHDSHISWEKLQKELLNLEIYIREGDVLEIIKVLEKLVKGFKSNHKITDHLFLEQKNNL
jgi:FlaA1/EpsC-like NDP-sugar epimerase